MENRINIFGKGQHYLQHLMALGRELKGSSVGIGLLELIHVRISQINGCAYCIDMHYKDARAHGETEQRLYGLSAWRESPYYSERERAAFAWAEAVTEAKVSDGVYNETIAHFSEQELVELTLTVSITNAWNRIKIALPHGVGTYKAGMYD